MKFLLFYLIRRIRRRPTAFLCTLAPAAIAVFCLATLTVDLASRAAVAQGDEIRFDSASFALLLALHVLLLLTSTAFLGADRRRRTADEAAILSALGVGRGRLILLELLEQAAAFLGGMAVGLPGAVGGYAAFAALANHRLGQIDRRLTVPAALLALGMALLFAAMLTGTLIVCLVPTKATRLRADGCFDGRRPVTATYRAIARRRRPMGMGGLLVAVTVQLLPILLLTAAFSFGSVAVPEVDYTVGLREFCSPRDPHYRDSLIPPSVCAVVAAIPGAELIEARPADNAPDCYTYLRLKFDDATRADGLAALDALAADGLLSPFHCINRAAEAARRRIDNALNRLFLLTLAAALLPMALLLCATLHRHAAEADDADMAILYAIGLPPDDIRLHFRRRMLTRTLVEAIPPVLLAGLVYNIMEVEGGGSRSLVEPLIVGLGWLALQLFLAALGAARHYRRFRRHRLGKSIPAKEAPHADQM